MRIRIPEIEDQQWLPSVVKEYMTDYLRFIFKFFDLYHPAIEKLKCISETYGIINFVDLCSGSGGAVERIIDGFKKKNLQIHILLTDIYPRIQSYSYLKKKWPENISFVRYPINALAVPLHIRGFRTMFSGIHHFSSEEVFLVLKSSVEARQGIAIYDGGNKNLLMILLILIFHPVAIILFTPFIKPFRIKRLILTYLFPVVPICVIWDGVASILSLYTYSELKSISQRLPANTLKWEAGKLRNKLGLSITYLTGIPV